MVKSMQLLAQLAKLAYLLMEATLLFYGLSLILYRFGFNPLPEVALIWFFPSTALLFLPLGIIQEKQQLIWLISAGIVSTFIGILLFGQPYSAGLLILTAMVLSVRSMGNVLRPGAFLQLITYTVGVFAIIRFFGIPFYFSVEENEGYIRMILLLILLMLFGMVFEQLPNLGIKPPGQRMYWQQWVIPNGILLVGLGGLAFIAWPISRGLDQMVSLVGQGFQQALLLLGGLLARLIPILQQESEDVIDKIQEQTEERTQETETQEELLDYTVNPWAERIMEIILFLGIGIGILLILLIVFKKIKYYLEQTKVQEQGNQIITHELIDDQHQEKSNVRDSILRKLKHIFQPYTGKEDIYVRKEYRKVLKLLRKKGIWDSNAFTVSQLEQVFRNLKSISPLYEKVRYGDQELSSEERAFFEKEIANILQEVEKT